MITGPFEFDCALRCATSNDGEQLDQIVPKALLEIYGQVEDGRPFTAPSIFAEIAVVQSEIIGVAASVDELLTCLYVVERFRNSGVGTCLLHNAVLSGVRAATLPTGNSRVLTFFERRGWRSHSEIAFDICDENLFGIAIAMQY